MGNTVYNSPNIDTPTPTASETPPFGVCLNSLWHSITDALLKRTTFRWRACIIFLLVSILALGCSISPAESVEKVAVAMTATPAASPTPRNTPVPTATPGVCVLADELARDHSNPCTRRNPCVPCYTPTPEPSEVEYCEKAAENIELMTSGKHPTMKNLFGVYVHIKFSEVRPTMEPKKCFGLATTLGSDSPERITFSHSKFRDWDRWQDGQWE